MATRLEIDNALWKTLYKSTDEAMQDLMSFALGLPVTNNPAGYVDVSGITNYSELSYSSVKALQALGVRVFNYPLFAYCTQTELDANTPNVLPGYETVDGEGVASPVKLKDWLASRNFTIQDLSNGKKGFGLPGIVSFTQGVALEGVTGFTVLDGPSYKALLPVAEE